MVSWISSTSGGRLSEINDPTGWFSGDVRILLILLVASSSFSQVEVFNNSFD